jgi:cytochrome c-type biogenesis protein
MELGGGMGDFLIAFLAGVVSFLSPCVLPLIPGYLSFITGVTPNELASEDRPVMRVLVPSLLFVAGFSVVFVGLGAGASALGGFFTEAGDVLGYVLGAFVFVMGFFMLGIVKVPWLYGEARMEMGKARAFGQGASFVMGMAFAFGWTPCVGPILASILAISMQNADAARGAALLAVYSLGLGVPFVLTGLLFGRLKSTMGWLNRHALVINRVAGVLLMVLGALIFFDKLSLVAGWFLRYLPSLEVGL